MSKASKSQIQQLKKYTKDDIIDAISREWNGEYFIESMLMYLDNKKIDAAFAENEKAIKAENDAMKAYLAWKSEMVRRFGDGNSVKIGAIPAAEIQRGDKLVQIWDDARKKLEGAEGRVQKLMEEAEKRE